MASTLDPLYNKNVTCLACEQPFQTKKVRSRFLRATKTDTDFCSEYENEEYSPLLYYVNVCPTCGYSFPDESSSNITNSKVQVIKSKLSNRWRTQKHYGLKRSVQTAIASYKLAIFSGQLKEENPLIMAGLNMRLTWIYRKEKNPVEEKRFMRNALASYEKSYFEEDLEHKEMSSTRQLYLMGELSRRLRDYKKAIHYFSLVIHSKEEVLERSIVEMARQQWYLVREDQKKEVKTLS